MSSRAAFLFWPGERGERNIALENIVKLTKALSVPMKDLFRRYSANTLRLEDIVQTHPSKEFSK
jgi:hypothetical protein